MMSNPAAGPITDPRGLHIFDSCSRLEYPPFGLDLFFVNGQVVTVDLSLGPPAPTPGTVPVRTCPPQIARDFSLYFAGHPVQFSFPTRFLPPYTEFQLAVWTALREIPLGQTRSYAWLAGRVGHPKAARAVGGALGRNPLPIIFPCHRIIESGGGLGGFSSGLETKRLLLRLEGICP